MDIILSILAILLALLGIVGCILPLIPGVMVSLGGVACIYFASFSTLTGWDLLLATLLATAVTIADFILPGYMTRRFGGSRAGAIGATVGMIVGMIFGGLLGIVVGPAIGAFLAEVMLTRSDSRRALRSAWGSFLAFVMGTGLKLGLSLWMAWTIAVQIWAAI